MMLQNTVEGVFINKKSLCFVFFCLFKSNIFSSEVTLCHSRRNSRSSRLLKIVYTLVRFMGSATMHLSANHEKNL